ncbi:MULTISPECIES: hypothetical protein [unclassified Caballeronia]|uniref:hypothetical protein n=1 Tax=unclassified Caballeronia TaxID=2646786 RepID=UPI001F3437A6|nr:MULTISPECIES: hypothetical protein [unclassified Caballeronia]MCE4548033.1 hypothetical protein [Caballeronia sp. PC1]MCE4575871.1 hypothetical protein [Caballeronia sp. CLC5]
MEKPEIDELTGARADLLCFLVATVAASYALTQEWRVDHVVASCRIWIERNRVTMDWLDRILTGQLALKIARRDLKRAGIAVRQSDVQVLFTGEMGLNHASTVVQKMMKLCREATGTAS